MVAWTRKRDASVAVGFCTAMTSGGGVLPSAGSVGLLPPPQAAITPRTAAATAPRAKRAKRPLSISKC
jgi:hypothetical protein